MEQSSAHQDGNEVSMPRHVRGLRAHDIPIVSLLARERRRACG